MDLHLIPGYFGDATTRFLGRLFGGAPIRTLGWRIAGGEGVSVELGADAALRRLADTETGATRRVEADGRIPGSRPLPLVVETFAARNGRLLVGLFVTLPDEAGVTHKDLEIAFLGLVCAGLGGEDQGAALLGSGLGPIGVGASRGTISEQLVELLSIHGEAIEVLILAPGTAASLGEVPGFVPTALGDLVLYRRE